MFRNGHFKIDLLLKKGGELPIHEHGRALRVYIAVACDALLSVNISFNCIIKQPLMH